LLSLKIHSIFPEPPQEDKYHGNFDASHNDSIPIMEGESLRDSEEDTRPLDGDSMTAVESLRIEPLSPPQRQRDVYEDDHESDQEPQPHEEEVDDYPGEQHAIQNESVPNIEEQSVAPTPTSTHNSLLVAQPSIEITVRKRIPLDLFDLRDEKLSTSYQHVAECSSCLVV
jgi:hypothetical protein